MLSWVATWNCPRHNVQGQDKIFLFEEKIKVLKCLEPSHPKHLELSNIEVVFLPENTTSLIQPMDQGIVKNFKGHYRSKLHHRIINSMDLNPDLTLIEGQKQVSLLKHGGFAPKNDEILNPLHDVDIPVDKSAIQPSNNNDEDEKLTGGLKPTSETILNEILSWSCINIFDFV